ncbi:CaiB/BaiF CoA transferase family protein [Aquabacter cavernae]|uniref:CaiB/BaiF CoA transferase family protein n=1 Tax=Aquabacter cavernae TaxID=2496029 RepID=UPI000F8CD421|nr:CoA transferase [Aquabacter cavernae]
MDVRAASLPLSGIRVLDLTAVVMGPYAGQMLGDLGADVIKVEPPEGDSTRHTGPAAEAGMAALFLGVNRNKRSVMLNLKRPEARAALLALVDGADVFMHSMRPQKLVGLGITPDELLARNPRLVYAGLHGFGVDGPYGGRPAYDDTVQGMSGLAAITQAQTGEARYFPTIAADKTSGLFAVNGIMAALLRRERTGQGGFVEIPMYESMVAFNLVEHFYGHHFDPPRGGLGYPRVLAAWRRPYRTLDGHICLMPYTNQHWRAFFTEVGRPELADDARFTDIAARTRNIDALYEVAGGHVAERTTAAWMEASARLQIPSAPVASLEDVVEDVHLRDTGFFATRQDPAMGTLRFPGVPLKFDGERPDIAMPPRLGEHSRAILAEAGLREDEIEALLNQGTAARTPEGAGA